MPDLLVLRHAAAGPPGPGGGDYSRALTRTGRAEALAVATRLAAEPGPPATILSSPAARAWQTALTVAEHLELPRRQLHARAELYLAPLPTLLEVVRAAGAEAHPLLLVGHNPGLEELVRHLCRGHPRAPADPPRLSTASLVRIELAADARTDPGCGRLASIAHHRGG